MTSPDSDSASIMVTVRYFAGAQAAVGVPEEDLALPAEATVADLVTAVAARCGEQVTRVLAASSFIVDEVSATKDQALRPGARIDVLPPFAGG